MMKYPWLLFDIDNTLLDFTGTSPLAFAQMMEQEGHSFESALYAIYKKGNAQVWHEFEEGKISAIELRSKRFRLFLEATGLSGDPLKMNAGYLQGLTDHARLLDGAKALLEAVHKKHRLAIITNGLKEVQRPRIAKVGIGHYFDAIIVSDEIGFAKPNPAFFNYTFQQIDQPPKNEVLVIGDSLNSDIKGGQNFGLDTCWYNPNNLETPTSIQATHTIQSLSQLLDLL